MMLNQARGDRAQSRIQRLSFSLHTYDADSIMEGMCTWRMIGAELPELTHLSLALKVPYNEVPLTCPADIAPIARLKALTLVMSPRSRWTGGSREKSPSFYNPPDPSPVIESFMSRLLPASPNLAELHVTWRGDYVSKKDARAGVRLTPTPHIPTLSIPATLRCFWAGFKAES